MKHLRIFCTILIMAAALPVFGAANGTFTISGLVRSQENGESLSGVNIYIAGTSIGVTSGQNGRFKLSALPRGEYTLKFNYIGYSEQEKAVILSHADTSLTVALNQEILSGPVVSVSASQARKRVSAVTFSEIDKQKLAADYSTQDMPELLSETPSTTFYSESGSGLGYNYLSIRGFGQRRISVLINGIPQNDPEDHNTYWVDFPDLAANVQQIQVQRGAGSSFYGPAAIGGSINILTNYFSPTPKFRAYFGAGSFNTKKMSASYNSGLLADTFVLYGRVSNMKTDGYRDRAWIDFWSYFIGGAMYTKNQNLRLHVYGGPIEDGLVYGGLPKLINTDDNLRRKNYSYWEVNDAADSITYAAERRSDEVEQFNQPHFEILHEYKINQKVSLNNALFYIRGNGYFDYDGSFGTPEYFRLTPSYGFSDSLQIPGNALIRAYVENNQLGWLPQLSWRDGNEEMVIGAELRTHRSLHWGRLQKGSGLPQGVTGMNGRHYYEYKGGKDIASVYFHQTHEIRPRLIFTGDMQFTFKRYHLFDEKFLNNDFSIDYKFLNPRIGLNYNIDAASSAYFSLSRTRREPRLKNYYDAAEASTPASWGAVTPQFKLNTNGSYNFTKPLVNPETLDGIETGYTFRSETLQGFVNVYYMYFKDEIIKSGALDRFGQPVTGNADRTLHRGIELGGKALITPQLSLSGNFSYSANKLISYSIFTSDTTRLSLNGNPIAGFPNLLANFRLTYAWKDLYASLAGRYSGKMYTDNFADEKRTVDPFAVFNFNLNWKPASIGLNGVTFQLQLNNLLNSRYLAHGEGDEYFPAATRNGFVGIRYEY